MAPVRLLVPNVSSTNQNLPTKSFRWHIIVGLDYLGPSPTWVQTLKDVACKDSLAERKDLLVCQVVSKDGDRSWVHGPRPLQHSHLVFFWLNVVLYNNNSRSSKIWIIAHSCLCFMTCAHCFIEF